MDFGEVFWETADQDVRVIWQIEKYGKRKE